jgi:carbon storage regulator CsrA
MLVMSHTTGDIIHIGDDIKIEIVKCDNGRVKIGYVAPKNIRILRDKVKQRIDRENSGDDIQDD